MKQLCSGLLLLVSSTVFSQQVGIGTKNPQALLHVDSGDVYFGGVMGPEIRKMIYQHSKSALQSGIGSTDAWHPDSTGEASMNVGLYNKAKGSYALTAGSGNRATGSSSLALGQNNLAAGNSSLALGASNNATGLYSLAAGSLNTSSGSSSVSVGHMNVAGNPYAVAIGNNNQTTGHLAVSLGTGIITRSYGETGLGMYNINKTPLAANSSNANDQLLVIGNGNHDQDRSNALVIKKNGNVGIGLDADNSTISYPNKVNIGGNVFIEGQLGIGTRTPYHELHLDGRDGVFTGLQLTSAATGRESNDGLLIGLQYQAGINENKYGFIKVFENEPLFLGTNNTYRLSISENGSVGIGLGGFGLAQEELEVAHGTSLAGTVTNGFKLRNNGSNNNNWILYTVNSTGNLNLYFNNNGTAKGSFSSSTGAYVNSSSRHLKDGIENLPDNTIDKLKQLQPKRYYYKADKTARPTLGLIAEEAAVLFPELVEQVGEGNVALGINYAGFSVVAIKAIQELTRRVEMLEKMLAQSNQEK
jgi:hypothetical protein